MRANSFASRVVAAARPTRPWLYVNASPRVARFLVEAGAREGKPVVVGNLERAHLRGADLRGRNLRYAFLSDADLTGADLRGADLTTADLTNADLTGADLTRAILIDAYLTGADLTDADLTGANLYGAYLIGALWSDTTRWPGSEARRMKARSEELRPGVWRVAGSGSADAGVNIPQVPV
jgi:hypothetical protein